MDKHKILKSTLLNIDSMYRNINPKNICTSDGKLLPSNPISLTQNSNIVKITYPNHGLSTGDAVVIQNVVGMSKILSNYIFLVNNFNYAIIVYTNINIDSNYKTYNPGNVLYANIDIVGSQTENNIINNIPFNNIPGYKNTLLYNDIPTLSINLAQSNINSLITNLSNLTSQSDINNYLLTNCLFVKLSENYINTQNSYYAINQVFKISYQHIGGIGLGYFNSNFPISSTNYQSNQIITYVDKNTFIFALNFKSYGTLTDGGNTIQVMKIINSMTGYPNADNYVINLKKSFNNVTKIELISSEFPYVDIIIKKNINDKLFWKHIEDGSIIYNVTVDEGFYTSSTLVAKLQEKMNLVPRITSTVIIPVYNHFDIMLETNIQKITFTPYNINKVPNGLSINLETINNLPYYILSIKQNNNFIQVGDTITITGATTVTYTNNTIYYSIPATYINNTFKVYSINPQTSTYNVIIGLQSDITEILTTTLSNGGGDTKIKTPTKVSFLFNTNNTMGEVIGFLNVGMPYSIIDYSKVITNTDSYINANNVNSAGNQLTYSSGFINLSGKFNYIIMYLNNIEYIYFNNNLNAGFAKIALNGNPGDILFNTYVPTPDNIYCKVYPISSLTDITVNFVYPDGSPINFRNINHSFTLKITEEHIENDTINLNSQSTTYIDEFKKVYTKA